MHEGEGGAVSVTAYPDSGNESPYSDPSTSSAVEVPALAPAPGRTLEEYSGAVAVTVYTEMMFNGSSGDKPSSSSAPLPSSPEEESSGDVSATAYPEVVLNGSSRNKASSVLAPSSAPTLGRIKEENKVAVSGTAPYPEEVPQGSGNNLFSDTVPSSAVAVPTSSAPLTSLFAVQVNGAVAVMVEENNDGAFSVTAFPEARHGPSSLAQAAPAPVRMLEEDNGAVPVTAYPEAGHVTVKNLSSPPSSAARSRTLEDYAKEWAVRKGVTGAPPHHCVLPFLTAAPKAVECRVCYKVIHPLDEIKCSVSRCEQSFHLTCVVEDTANFTAESFKCPQHGCMVCKQKMFFWRCGRCTVAAHTKCAPWPLIHLKDDQGSAICWRHPSNWLLQNENADLTNNIEEAFCRLPLPYVNEEFNIDSTIRNFSAIVCKPPAYTHIKRNVYLVKKKRADSSAETGCRNCRADSVCRDDCECRGLSMSCSKSCRCSDLCTNKPFRKDKKFKIVKSEGCGWGAVALEPLEKGDFIIEYVGEVINDATCEQRLWEMKRRGDKNFYMCEISKDCTIDATFKGNTSRFLNHSCDPNCKLEKWQVDGEIRVGVFASRSIQVGEPLTYDYRFVHFGEKVKCNCGAKSCQGYLGIQLKNPSQDALVAAALASPSSLKPETHLLPWTNCIEVPFNLRSKTKIDRICWGRKRQRTSIIDPSPSTPVTESASASVPKGFSAELA
ncbi:histone-lysine N-methyltransferase ASHR3-like [Lolium rigidum]|uniref:histone-lysine N-methyltransferase ASHR3-like n=1 Tax=Lolium rigidum TaxID=89674 RepID=UPI001F5D2EBC|nr:histone-lysine N-methyltransferase ASHR3-like [Lolium rigidum]